MADHPSRLSAVELHSRDAVEFDNRYRTEKGFLERQAVWSELIRRYNKTGSCVLDLGCGSGELVIQLADSNAQVTALDGSASMLDICKRKLGERDNVKLVCADISDAHQFGAAAFDLIVASSVLEYIDDFDGVLAMIWKLLVPGGTFILSLPNRASLYRRIEPLLYAMTRRPNYFPYIRNRATAAELQSRLRHAGLEVMESRYLGRTWILSALLRPVGMARWSDNLLLIACRKPVPPAG